MTYFGNFLYLKKNYLTVKVSLATTTFISVDFFSVRYLDVSVHEIL